MASSSKQQQPMVCFNSNCKEVPKRQRKGWRRRTGEFADLCERCASAYEDGKFCETFHSSASGWRACESCGKKIHCGCIVSFHTFVLLDAGGIECITCARKSFILTPNPAWPPPSHFPPLQTEGTKESRSWTPIAGSGRVPWRQAPSLFNGGLIQPELQPKTPYIDLTGSTDGFHLTDYTRKEDTSGIPLNKSLKSCVPGKPENETTGFGCAGPPNPFASCPDRTSVPKNDFCSPNFRFTIGPTTRNEVSNPSKIFTAHTQPTTISSPVGRQSCSQNSVDSSGEAQTCSVKYRGDVGGKHHLLPRYWPQITDKELHQISGDMNSVITPLFEKMLSASDAGKIGRLVLPKKCAEAYFPPIPHPEGLPLKVQDLKGNEWVFQFRFWPNNNSRMYVLEGVTACMQSMQLQAGDIVTFSRIEPEGKLIMGCRKLTSTPSVDQGLGTSNTPIGVANNGSAGTNSVKPGEILTKCFGKGNSASPAILINNQACSLDSRNNNFPELNESTCIIASEVVESKSPVRRKRKNNTISNPKSKQVRINSEQLIELNLTVVQAQQLLRPSPNNAPTVIVIEGYEFEEYEHDAPIIGRPTIPCTGSMGEKFQWAQCEDCYKWRKISADALLQARWTCSQNLRDPDRSVCSAAEELTAECLAGLIPSTVKAAKKRKKASSRHDDIKSPDTTTSTIIVEAIGTALENLVLHEYGEGGGVSSSQPPTTKHPRHRPGCTCIVCIQPPSGKGPKHKQHCDCNLCKSAKRRFNTMMLKKGKKPSEKEDAGPTEAECNSQSSDSFRGDDKIANEKKSYPPLKGGIDLNMKPDRERDDFSPFQCDSPSGGGVGVMSLLQDAADRLVWHHGLPGIKDSSSVVAHHHHHHHQVINLNGCGPPSDGSRGQTISDVDHHMVPDNLSPVMHAEK
ncbi:unnamed protein product [Cuscuta europaea]|uniref:Uncharacterized protein n=1 Tax=Cuscuta europaea TaxID=41803 RepID=A0A9P0YIW9_CUSEU|nr:unnamed protein product [Cuscuta europaea]